MFSFFQNGLRGQVLMVSRFCFTRYYFLFVLFSVLPLFCKVEGSIISLVCNFIVFYTLCILSRPFFYFCFQILVGQSKKQKICQAKVFQMRTLAYITEVYFSLFFFLLTISLLGLIDSFSLLLKVKQERANTDILIKQVRDFADQLKLLWQITMKPFQKYHICIRNYRLLDILLIFLRGFVLFFDVKIFVGFFST